MSNGYKEEKEPTYMGIPRKEIAWFPAIDYDKCAACMSCVDFCPHGVYRMENGKPAVKYPYQCIVGCTNCKSKCANDSISFPSTEIIYAAKKKYGITK